MKVEISTDKTGIGFLAVSFQDPFIFETWEDAFRFIQLVDELSHKANLDKVRIIEQTD